MALDKTNRQERFQDVQKGASIAAGYKDAVNDDPFDEKFIKRQVKSFDTLKKAGLHKDLSRLADYSDPELEALAAKAVIEQSEYKPKKLNTKYNRKKYDIKAAMRVQKRKQAGQPVRRQRLRQTREARAHIMRVQRNRRLMRKPLYPNLPEGY